MASRGNVLVIEDDQDIRRLIGIMMFRAGFDAYALAAAGVVLGFAVLIAC